MIPALGNTLEKGSATHSSILRLLYCSVGKKSSCNVGDLGSIPGLERSPGEGKGYPLQYWGLENSMDCRVHSVSKSWTQLSDLHFNFSLSVVITFSYQNKILIEYQHRKEKIQRMLKYRIEAFGLLRIYWRCVWEPMLKLIDICTLMFKICGIC